MRQGQVAEILCKSYGQTRRHTSEISVWKLSTVLHQIEKEISSRWFLWRGDVLQSLSWAFKVFVFSMLVDVKYKLTFYSGYQEHKIPKMEKCFIVI